MGNGKIGNACQPQSSAEFFVRHRLVSLSNSPQLSHLLRVDDSKNPVGTVFPLDDVAGHLVSVVAGVQEVSDKFPQVTSVIATRS